MPDVPPTTSASQLVAYAMCPRVFMFRYVVHAQPEFRSLSLVLGSVVHSAIGYWFEERLAERTPTVAEVDDIVAADLLAETAQATIRWKDDTPASVETRAQGLVRAYLTRFGDMKVVGVEQRFQADLVDADTGERLPRPLVGYFDLVVDEAGSIVEVKTTSRAWHPLSLERHLQVGAYVAAANALHGGPSRVRVHTITKAKVPKVDELVVERGESGNRWFFGAARAIERAILAGHFPPSPGPTCFECEFGKACLKWGEDQPAQQRPNHRSAPRRPELHASPS
jgi:hypothetical protein